MSRKTVVFFLALVAACASTVLASAQATSSQTEVGNSSTSPVAFIYITNPATSSTYQVNAYAASKTGALTLIPGSPYPYNLDYMAVNGAWLFGVANLFEDIDSFAIGSNGVLTLKDSLTVVTNGDGLISDYLDHTGSTLYADLYSTNNDYLSFNIDQSTGQVNQIGDLPGGPANGSPVSFIGNNLFAYSSSCYHFGPEIIGVQRNSDGTLAYLNSFNPPFPAEKSGGFYCPWLAAADPTNHVAIAMQPLNSNWGADGPWQLATYTADAAGNLTTTSIDTNMPTVLVGAVSDYWMSPNGKYLAVGGASGLQIFHFNGANPITKFTSLLLSGKQVDRVVWDNANHLYAVGYQAGKLWVFTVTASGAKQAPGSPHSITSPSDLIVLPKN